MNKQKLLSWFEEVARKEPLLMQHIAGERNFLLEDGLWLFTLPQLFDFLHYQDSGFIGVDYPQFRKLVFNCPINRTIRAHGAEIVIIDNKHKVDRTTYALVWHES